MEKKKCTKCKEIKSLSEFYNNRSHKSGKTFWCKTCSNHQSNCVQKESKALWAARAHQNRRRNKTNEYLYRMAKRRAKDYNREFTITPEDIVIPTHCPYTGVRFSFDSKDTAPSLDRKDSKKGYTKENIQVISWRANQLKSDATEEFLVAFARGILVVHAKGGPGPYADQM